MNAMINVARYHLVQPVLFVTLPLAMAFVFAVNAARGRRHLARRNGRSSSLYFFIMGVQRAGGRWLPFGLALGADPPLLLRWYRAARGVDALCLRPGDSRAAGHRVGDRRWHCPSPSSGVPYLLNGPWYATWLTSSAGLSALLRTACGTGS